MSIQRPKAPRGYEIAELTSVNIEDKKSPSISFYITLPIGHRFDEDSFDLIHNENGPVDWTEKLSELENVAFIWIPGKGYENFEMADLEMWGKEQIDA